MTMFDSYEFEVIPAAKSGSGPVTTLPAYSGGSLTAQRSFKVPCVNAQEFAFRMLGRYYEPVNFEDPVLPVEYPWDDIAYTQMGRMVAIGFRIDPLCEGCFNSYYGEGNTWMTDPSSYEQLENYYINPRDGEDYGADPAECDCIVKIDYATPPWTCTAEDLGGSILANTAIRVQRNPAYELFSVPSRTLAWKYQREGVDRILKGDSHATILIPKADVTIEWFNIPVRYLCQIVNHLNTFRGTVNSAVFGSFLDCESYSDGSGSAYECNNYEAETLQFIDWEEIDQYRTSSFRLMDSTAVRIHLKQKRVVDPNSELVKGWNHLFRDNTAGTGPSEVWQEVVQIVNGVEVPFYPKVSWANLLNPTLI